MQLLALPNILSLSRLPLAWLFWFSLVRLDLPPAALAVGALAALSDVLDGAAARRLSMQTKLGLVLDPLADKVFLVTAFLSLTHVGVFSLWVLIVVALKELLMLIGGALLLITGQSIPPAAPWGKAATVIGFVGGALLMLQAPGRQLWSGLIALAAVTSLLLYAWTAFRGSSNAEHSDH